MNYVSENETGQDLDQRLPSQAKETAAGAVCDVICDLVSIDVATEQL